MIRANVDFETTEVSRFPCPYCGKRLHHDSYLSGRLVKCPKCGSAFRMPQVMAMSPEPVAPEQEALTQIAKQYRCKQTRQHAGRRWSLAFAVMGLSLVGAVMVFKIADDKNDAVAKSPEEEPVSPGIIESVVDVAIGRSARDKIIGKWQEIGKTEIVEFFLEGTVTITDSSKGGSLTGDYRFLNDGDDRLRMDIGGFEGKLAGPLICTVAVTNDKLDLTLESNGEVSRYQRFSKERGSKQREQLAFDLTDMARTNRWVQRAFAAVPTGNEIIYKEAVAELDRQCSSFVGQEVTWQMPVVGVTSEYVLVNGTLSHIETEFVNSDGLDRYWGLQRDEDDVQARMSGLSSWDDPRYLKLKEAKWELMKKRSELASQGDLLKIGEQVSRDEARLLKEGSLLAVCGTVRQINVQRGKVLISLQEVRSSRNLADKRSSRSVEKPQPLGLEECQRIIRQHVQKELRHDAGVEVEWFGPHIVRVGYGLHLVKPDLPADAFATVVSLKTETRRSFERERSWMSRSFEEKCFWIRDGKVVYEENGR